MLCAAIAAVSLTTAPMAVRAETQDSTATSTAPARDYALAKTLGGVAMMTSGVAMIGLFNELTALALVGAAVATAEVAMVAAIPLLLVGGAYLLWKGTDDGLEAGANRRRGDETRAPGSASSNGSSRGAGAGVSR